MVNRFFSVVLASLVFCASAQAFGLFSFFSHSSPDAEVILSAAPGLKPEVLSMALKAYNKLRQQGYDQQQVLTIVDYSRPSNQARLWVIDLKNLKVAVQAMVSHGRSSGENMAQYFSNKPQSYASSLGVYLTADTYVGHKGYSLRLNGLEPGFNSNALKRDIVVHPADYATEEFAAANGRLGRSEGCLAVSPKVASQLINNIKNGTVVFAYYPDKEWLDHSQYINI